MQLPDPTIALLAKYPLPGFAKTRLIPALGPQGAARVHRLLVEHTLAAIRASGLPFMVWTTGAPHADFVQWLGEDVPLVEQGEGDLGARLAQVPTPAILLGADIPDLTAQHLRSAAQWLEKVPAVIGPAGDGGYYLLGLSHPMPWLFTRMDWGTEHVLGETIRRLKERDVPYKLLAQLDDCDRPEDLPRWPDLAR